MGEYLKQAYEERDLAIALAKVHGIIDEENQKLSDKYKNLELSHKRKINLLKKIEKIVKLQSNKSTYKYEIELWENLAKQINKELTCYGRLKGEF